jgi:hypothetical protein
MEINWRGREGNDDNDGDRGREGNEEDDDIWSQSWDMVYK